MRGSSWPRDQTWVSYLVGRFFTIWDIREATEAKSWKQPKCPSTDEWINIPNVMYSYNGILLGLKKEALQYATTWMKLQDIMLRDNPATQILYDST